MHQISRIFLSWTIFLSILPEKYTVSLGNQIIKCPDPIHSSGRTGFYRQVFYYPHIVFSDIFAHVLNS